MILLGSYICYTTNTLDTIEAFIAETYVQLVATESMCYSTSCSTLTGVYCNIDTVALYCAVPYIASCVDVSRTVLSGPFSSQVSIHFCHIVLCLICFNLNIFLIDKYL